MIPAEFDYVRAGSVDEAVAALVQRGEEAKVMAGGQSLIPLLRLRLAYPELVVDVGRVAEMKGVREEGDQLVVGAMTTHAEVLDSELVRTHCGLLAEATETVADPAVRHRGTFGGALAHADPAGDLPAVALALDAELVIAGSGGRRTVAAKDFFVDYLQTAIGADEVLVEVRLPKLGAG
ncbi:MAG: FAD binding domain-containing protein, partial [Actinomycetes bacterium]